MAIEERSSGCFRQPTVMLIGLLCLVSCEAAMRSMPSIEKLTSSLEKSGKFLRLYFAEICECIASFNVNWKAQ